MPDNQLLKRLQIFSLHDHYTQKINFNFIVFRPFYPGYGCGASRRLGWLLSTLRLLLEPAVYPSKSFLAVLSLHRSIRKACGRRRSRFPPPGSSSCTTFQAALLSRQASALAKNCSRLPALVAVGFLWRWSFLFCILHIDRLRPACALCSGGSSAVGGEPLLLYYSSPLFFPQIRKHDFSCF